MKPWSGGSQVRIPNTHRGGQSIVPAVHRKAVKLRTRHSQEGGQNSELIIKDTVGCQNWLLGHEAVKSVFHMFTGRRSKPCPNCSQEGSQSCGQIIDREVVKFVDQTLTGTRTNHEIIV